MDFDKAEERAKKLGFEICNSNVSKTWFQAQKRWSQTGQTIVLEVWPNANTFELSKMEGTLRISTDKVHYYNDDVHFLNKEFQFMQVIKKLN
ncbi:TPA: hypothetical protein ACTZ3A_001263 [Bacillus cereus]